MASSRVRRRLLIALAGATGLLTVLALAGLPVYVFPPAQRVDRADVVMVLGPATDPRIAQARRLVADGAADAILVSVPAPGEPAADLGICDEPAVTCATPDPFSTAGETALLRTYAAQHGIRSAIVLTSTPHVSRARYLFDRCVPDTSVTVVAVPSPMSALDWVVAYAYQSGAFLKAFLTPCPG